jgi:hypothetical protein
MFFRCEIFGKDGKLVESKHIQVSAGGVEDATKDSRVQELKQKASRMGCGFRVKREDD